MSFHIQSSQRVIWAIDIFEGNSGPLLKVAEIIRDFQLRWPAVRVEPVHVLGSADLGLSVELTGPRIAAPRADVERALGRLIRNLELRSLESPHVIVQQTMSTAHAAQILAEYAANQNADLIVVGSHGRKGMSRLLSGSFAESLLTRSSVPVLVVGPKQRQSLDFSRMLFPTDFAEGSKEAFRHAIDLTRRLGAGITLYHAIERLAVPIYPSGVYSLGAPWIPMPEDIEREKESRLRRLRGWARWAMREGVPTDLVVETEVNRVASCIVDRARELRAGWIAMASHSGPVASMLLGSVARQVVRSADCPVWVTRLSDERARRARHAREGRGAA